jgi:serine/threonine protein kinase
MELATGLLFGGRYRIEKQLGKGGMGAVYLARQEPLSRPVAIKVLHGTADEVVVARFQREARLIAQLQHPHIVGLIDFGEDSGRLYLVMEYIDGEPLTALLKREAPLSPRRACDIAIKVAEALAVAHDLHVVHRDVKPDNIMVLRSAGGQDFVKMLDFGVAKIKRDGEAQNTIETKAGLIVGSLRYISPEQVESGEITPRTDLYSFGCILYEMVAGRRVFDYPSPADCAIAHLTEMPKPPTVAGRAIRGPFVDFIMRCLEKKPSRRPADAREALKVLMACRDNPAEVDAEVEGGLTLRAVGEGLDVAQGARTIEARPITVTPAVSVQRPEAKVIREPLKAPTAPERGADPPSRMPDVELRPQRAVTRSDPSGVNRVSALEGNLQTAQRPRPAVATRRIWPWILLAIILVGGGFGTFLVVQ